MNKDEEIAAAIHRVMAIGADAAMREAVNLVAKFINAGGVQNSGRIPAIAQICIDRYRMDCASASALFSEIEEELAPDRAAVLDGALREAQGLFMDVYDKQVSPRGPNDPLRHWADLHRPELQKSLDSVREGTVANVRLGIAGSVTMKKLRGGVSIDNRGGAGQFSINSPGARQKFVRDQIVGRGLDFEAITAALRQLRAEIARAALPTDAAERIEDAIVNAERELDQPAPDQGRMRRLLGQVVTIARDIGVNVTGGLIAAGLTS